MGKTKRYKGKFLTFHQARKIARTLGLKSKREWEQLKDRPKNIPFNPHLPYKEYGWTSYPDFLNYKPYKHREKFLPFEQAREFVRSLGLKKAKADWAQYSRSGKRPENIPSTPNLVYKGQYKGLRDWVGLPEKIFLPFTKARKYVRENMTGRNWWECCRNNRPSNIPFRPDVIYKNEGWKSWKDWFGKRKKKFLPYKKARALARTLGIKGSAEWNLLCKQRKRPKEIPACPNSYYKEYVSYSDFFGYKRRKKAKKNRG